jgi:hypothetical protein
MTDKSRQCAECGKMKPESEFYVYTTGLLYRKCKKCHSALSLKARWKRIEYYREYDRERAHDPERRAAAVSRIAEYQNTHKDRHKAVQKLNRAVKKGIVIKWPACAVPGCHCKRVVGHHPDYSSPLEVVWMCEPHHRQLHAMAKKLEEEAAERASDPAVQVG